MSQHSKIDRMPGLPQKRVTLVKILDDNVHRRTANGAETVTRRQFDKPRATFAEGAIVGQAAGSFGQMAKKPLPRLSRVSFSPGTTDQTQQKEVYLAKRKTLVQGGGGALTHTSSSSGVDRGKSKLREAMQNKRRQTMKRQRATIAIHHHKHVAKVGSKEPTIMSDDERNRRLKYLEKIDRRVTDGVTVARDGGIIKQLRSYYGSGENDISEEEKQKKRKEAEMVAAMLAKTGVKLADDGKGKHGDDERVNAFYTNKGLMQRESLRYDPAILAILDQFWRVSDGDGSGKVDREEYITMSVKLYYVVVGSKDDDEEDDAHATAEEEWEHDCLGYTFLDKARFKQAWFQLADMWTETVDPDEYATFLADVLGCLTYKDETGKRRWNEDRDVQTLKRFRKKKKNQDLTYTRRLWDPKHKREKFRYR